MFNTEADLFISNLTLYIKIKDFFFFLRYRMETPIKKGAWRVHEIMICMDAYLNLHRTYKAMKKSGQAKQFRDKICDTLNLLRGCTENLMKNIGREYRDEGGSSMATGGETRTPTPRGSSDLLK